MKQAILITAYKNYEHLEKIIQFFDEDSFEIYIHVDRKSLLSDSQLLSFKKYNSLKLITQKYKVNWGGFNHLKSILYLAKEALKNQEINCFHLITGHDFPIKKTSYFIDFFRNCDNEFIGFFRLPIPGGANNGYMDRVEYYNFFDVWDYKNNKQSRKIELVIQLQKRLGFKRKINSNMPKLYGGSTYWSLSRSCVSYVMEFTRNNSFFLKRFKYTLCAEEFYFQTIIMNSHFADKVTNDNLRHIEWSVRNGNNPAILDETDYNKLKQTNAIFARKFDYPRSIDLLNKIEIFLK